MSKFSTIIQNDFTTVHNAYLRDNRLGSSEIGLLTFMLSLPPTWDFSIAGLTKVLRDGEYKIGKILNRLNAAGYFRRVRIVDSTTGRVIDWDYQFSDEVHEEWIRNNDEEIPSDMSGSNGSDDKNSDYSNPHLENPDVVNPDVVNSVQSNTNKINTQYIDSDHIIQPNNVNKITDMETEKEIKENIQYERLCSEYGENAISPITHIITAAMASNNQVMKINKKKIHKRDVQAKLALLRYEHICQLIKNMQNANPNPKYYEAYMLTALYNVIDKEKNKTSSASPQSPAGNFFDAIKQRVNDSSSDHSYNLELLLQHAINNAPKLRTC